VHPAFVGKRKNPGTGTWFFKQEPRSAGPRT
jgi:hypothetical protein